MWEKITTILENVYQAFKLEKINKKKQKKKKKRLNEKSSGLIVLYTNHPNKYVSYMVVILTQNATAFSYWCRVL